MNFRGLVEKSRGLSAIAKLLLYLYTSTSDYKIHSVMIIRQKCAVMTSRDNTCRVLHVCCVIERHSPRQRSMRVVGWCRKPTRCAAVNLMSQLVALRSTEGGLHAGVWVSFAPSPSFHNDLYTTNRCNPWLAIASAALHRSRQMLLSPPRQNQ